MNYIVFSLVMMMTLMVGGMSAIAQQLSDPCPSMNEASRSNPGDMAGVQSDIERYTLCVQRAVLIQRLNEIAKNNQNAVTPDVAIDRIEGLSYSLTEIEEMIDNLQNQQAEVASLIDEAAVDESGEEVVDTNAPAEKTWVFSITDVSGVAGAMHANLKDQDNVPYRVKVGDALADGSTVISINPDQVVVKKDGSDVVLLWDNPSEESGF